MRLLKPLVLALYGLCAAIGLAQFPAPQINLSGTTGVQGSPFLNNGPVQFATDANRAMTPAESSGTGGIKIISAVSLTATRSYVIPSMFGKLQFLVIENATTGGQAISICVGTGTTCGSGSAITIQNGQTASGVWFDGTNVVGTISPFSTTTPTYGQIPVYSTSLNQYVPSLATALYADLEPGADECAKINAAIASLGGAPGLVTAGNGQVYTCATTIVKPLNVTLDGNMSTIVWNPGTNTGGPIQIYSSSTPTTSQANGGVQNFVFETPLNGSGVPVTSPSTTTTYGVFLGADPAGGITPSTSWGAFQRITNTWFYGFNSGVEYGSNTWLLNMDHVRIAAGNNAIVAISGTTMTNSGEKMVFTNGAIYNNSGCGLQAYGYTQQWSFSNMSFDYNAGGAVCNISGFGAFFEMNAVHLENTAACFINLAGSYQSTGNMTDVDVFVNASTGTFNGVVCGPNSTSSFDIKGLSVQSAGATINYAVYTGGIASTNLCMTAPQYLLGSTKTTLAPTDAVLANCGAQSFGASIAQIIPTFVAPTGTTAYGLEVTQPTGGTANNEAINVIGGIQLSNVGGSSGTGDLYALQAKNYGTGGIYVNLAAGVNYVSERFYGPTQTWGVGLFGNTTFCPAEDLTNLTSGAPTCILSVQPASPINSIAIGTGAVTVNDNLTVNNAGGSGGTSELDVTAHNLGTGATFITAQAGSDGYGALRTINGSQVWAMGSLGGPDWILESYNGSLTRNVIDINSGAPASSLLITSGGSLSAYGGYAIQSNTVIPSTVTGYTGGSDTLVQLASGFGASGLLPMYDSAGGLMSSGAISYSSGGLVVNNVLNVANAGAGSGTGELDINATNYGAGGTYINAKTTANNYSAFRVFNGSNDWAIGNLGGLDLIFQHYNGTATSNVMDISASAPANSLNIAATTGTVQVLQLLDSGLTAGNCVQAGTGGLLTTTGAACGSGSGGVSQIVAGTNIALSPTGGTGTVTVGTTASLTATSYSVGSKTVIPSTVTGYAGGSGDTLVQLTTSQAGGYATGAVPTFDAAGGLQGGTLIYVTGVGWEIDNSPYTGSTSTFGLKVNAGTGGTGTNYALDTENGDVLINKNISGSDLNFQMQNYASGNGSYATVVANSDYASFREIGLTQSWGEGMFGATNWCLYDETASHCVVNVAAGAPAGALTISSAGALTATSAASAFAASTTIGGSQVCLVSGTNCPSSSGYTLGGALSSSNISCSVVGSVSISGYDNTHQINFVADTDTISPGPLCTVTFATAKSHTSYCTMSPTNQQTAGDIAVFYFSANSSTGYTISNTEAGLSGTFAFSVNVNCP